MYTNPPDTTQIFRVQLEMQTLNWLPKMQYQLPFYVETLFEQRNQIITGTNTQRITGEYHQRLKTRFISIIQIEININAVLAKHTLI